MKQFLLFILLVCNFYTTHLDAQNFISNGGFEEMKGRAVYPQLSINLCKDWFAAYMMGTDYYNRATRNGENVPKNHLGTQDPHSGDAYAGICLHWKYLEYLQTKLVDTLNARKTYLVEFYVSRAEKSINSVSELGILFTESARRTIDDKGLTELPSVRFSDKKGLRDKEGWTKLSSLYEADGTEVFLILGYFVKVGDSYSGFCHYYIDDVSIIPWEEKIGAY